MKSSTVCPACHATNKHRAELCRVCGERLLPAQGTSVPSNPPLPHKDDHGPPLDGRARGLTSPGPMIGSRLTDPQVTSLLGEVHAFSERRDFDQPAATAGRILKERP